MIRVREFFMKDAYSFDANYEDSDKSYQKMYLAYKNIFDKMCLNYKIVTAVLYHILEVSKEVEQRIIL